MIRMFTSWKHLMNEVIISKHPRVLWLVGFQTFFGVALALIAVLSLCRLARIEDTIGQVGQVSPHLALSIIDASKQICHALLSAGGFLVLGSFVFWWVVRRIQHNGVSNNTIEETSR